MSDDGDSYYVEAPDREPFQDVTYKVNIVEPPMPNIRNAFSSAPPKKMNKKHLSEGQSLKLSERSLNHSMGSMNSSDRQMEQKQTQFRSTLMALQKEENTIEMLKKIFDSLSENQLGPIREMLKQKNRERLERRERELGQHRGQVEEMKSEKEKLHLQNTQNII